MPKQKQQKPKPWTKGEACLARVPTAPNFGEQRGQRRLINTHLLPGRVIFAHPAGRFVVVEFEGHSWGSERPSTWRQAVWPEDVSRPARQAEGEARR